MKKTSFFVFAFTCFICCAGTCTAQPNTNTMNQPQSTTPLQQALRQMIIQNKVTNMGLDQVSTSNAGWRLNDSTASIGFIYRHIAETINLFGLFYGLSSEVANSTMGQTDTGQGSDVEQSRVLIAEGYAKLEQLVDTATDDFWLETIDTPFFGRVSRFRLFCHIMYHNSHHAGQISLTLSRASQR